MLMYKMITVGLTLSMLAACAETVSNEPITVDLPHLVAEHEAYDGRVVNVSGRVASFDDPRHYWLEDDEFNRVALLPDESVSDKVGEQVHVIGSFSTSPDQGRQIEVTGVTRVE